jgi:predicted MFS family arabinose efflux permease
MTTGLSLLSISFFSKLLDKERNKPFRIASTINAIVNFGRGLLINFAPIIVWDYFGRLGETLRLQTGLTNSYDMITDKVEPEHKDELNALHTITANFFIGVGLIIGGLVVHFFSFAAGFVLIAVVNLSAYLIRFNSDDFH